MNDLNKFIPIYEPFIAEDESKFFHYCVTTLFNKLIR